MEQQIASRLADLKEQFGRGQARLHELDAELTQLRETMLRISGAIQVLEEIQAADGTGDGQPA